MRKTIFFLILIFVLVVTLVYAGGYMEPLTKGLADTLYCSINDCNPDNTMYIDIDASLYNSVRLNISQGEADVYRLKVKPGRHFVFGGELT